MGASLPHIELDSFATTDELTRTVASAWLDEVQKADQARKAHCVALSGGRIAQQLFARIAEQADRQSLSLRSVHFFWADERCVPPEDADSNYRMAQQLLFARLEIPAIQIHRVPGEDRPEIAAAKAEAEIRRIVPAIRAGQPVLNLVLLGMGEDGHVASLFPGEPESLQASPAVYRAVHDAPKPPPDRVTLGYPAIAAAEQVWVLASGPGKENALRRSLELSDATPLARVLKLRRHTTIFTDIVL